MHPGMSYGRGGRGGNRNEGPRGGNRGGRGRGGGNRDGNTNNRYHDPAPVNSDRPDPPGQGGGFGGRGGFGAPQSGRGRFGPGSGFQGGPNPSPPFSTNRSEAVAVDKDDVSTWRQKDFHAIVRAFVENQDNHELSFPATLSPAQRNLVHRIAIEFKLDHKSSGPQSERILTLTKTFGDTYRKQRQEAAAGKGQRIKTIEGYQGAQLLPDEFLGEERTEEILKALRPHQLNMYRDIQLEANRHSDRAKEFRVSQPGLPTVPASKQKGEQYAALQKFRHSLPTYKRRDEIVSTVAKNDVTIVSGDTGCGKTTQIPQMLFDSGIFPRDTSIICTQPRRISALSVAQRVAEERGEACGSSCGYIIRFENVTSRRTQIIYQTTGILLRRLHGEPELRGVACVIVDEVHERDVETDFCLLLLRDRILAQTREPDKYPLKLKLVVMSATVQIEALLDYFSGANRGVPVPLITIPGTLFPVEEYFLEDAMAWVGASKASVPAMALLKSDKGKEKKPESEGDPTGTETALYSELKSSVFEDNDRDAEALVPYDLICSLIVHMHQRQRDLSGSILVFLPGWAAIDRIAQMLRRSAIGRELSVLMLHSSLTSAEQQRVFQPPPKRYRKVVLATSIAETSITIDDIVYVIDSGLVKGTTYDPAGNTSALRATIIGKANGVQRRGRAGRCRPGICVHLLPAKIYNDQPDFLPPEIVRSPLEEICLQIKAIQPDERCASVLARALSPPPPNSVEHAVAFLTEVGALSEHDERLTNLGRALAQLPVHPLLGKMLFAAACFGVLDTVATIAAGLSVKSPFIKPLPFQKNACRESLLRLDNNEFSDHMCVVKVFKGWVKSGRSVQYASEHFADPTTLRSLERTKQQLTHLVLRSPLVRRMANPLKEASRHSSNNGLARLVVLWSLYPRLATLEYRANRHTNKPQVFCWDNKNAQFGASSVLFSYKRNEIGYLTFVMYYERMQLESVLNLFDSSLMSPVEVALCLRQLTVRPLVGVPDMLLKDEESALAPPVKLNVDNLENKEEYSAMLFDGDKKLYVAKKRTALAVQIARECMDYYLALSIKKLRADAFPQDLVRALALVIGFPLSDAELNTDNTVESTYGEEFTGATEGQFAPGNKPTFVRGYESDADSPDDEGPILVDEDDALPQLHFSEAQVRKVVAAFGDLAIFRRDGAEALLQAAQVGEMKTETPQPAVVDSCAPKGNDNNGNAAQGTQRNTQDGVNDDDEEDEEDEDTIVAAVGALSVQ